MNIVRIPKKKDNYTVISHNVLGDKVISLAARGLLCLLFSKPPTWKVIVRVPMRDEEIGNTEIRGLLEELMIAGGK